MVDPPSGWRYGFPKPIPNSIVETHREGFINWFIENGYPKHLIDQGFLKHCRYWEEINES